MIRCTVGVMAYNEEHTIVESLYALLAQQTITCEIGEIVVVASGCTDGTVELVCAVARDNPIVRVDVQPVRAGKAAAINRLLQLAENEIIVLAGADTLPDPDAVEQLVSPFSDPLVGMTGARVIPLNDPRTFVGFAVQMLWQVHHRMALRWPKLGELVAFRNLVGDLPAETATDEVALEALITAQGYRLVYTPAARVYNYGPETVEDFLIQRRRIFAGHLNIARRYHYQAASLPISHLALLALEATDSYPSLFPLMCGSVLLEFIGRICGTFDAVVGRRHAIWRPVRSSKKLGHPQHTLTLVALHCREGTLQPDELLDRAARVPTEFGRLFWWDHRGHEMMFLLRPGLGANANLAESVTRLAGYACSGGAGDVCAYRVVRFATAEQSAGSVEERQHSTVLVAQPS